MAFMLAIIDLQIKNVIFFHIITAQRLSSGWWWLCFRVNLESTALPKHETRRYFHTKEYCLKNSVMLVSLNWYFANVDALICTFHFRVMFHATLLSWCKMRYSPTSTKLVTDSIGITACRGSKTSFFGFRPFGWILWNLKSSADCHNFNAFFSELAFTS